MKDSDILLINPGAFTYLDRPWPPYQLLFLAPALKKAGYRVKIFDFQTEKIHGLTQFLKDTKPLWVGITAMTGPPIKNALVLAQTIRNCYPEVPIVWGGVHPTLLPEQTLAHKLVDMVVIGEGEDTVVELSKGLEGRRSLKDIRGIGFKEGGVPIITPFRPFYEDWDRNVTLDWDLIDIEKYVRIRNGLRNLPFITSRGCPFRCAFCWNIKGNRREWRGWTVEGVMREVKKLKAMDIQSITIQDDYITGDLERLRGIVVNVTAMGLKMSFDGGFRPDARLKEELFKILKDTGCKNVNFGAESGSPSILRYIKKDLSAEHILRSAELSKKYNIGATYNWLIGLPGESMENVFESLDLIDRIKTVNPGSAHVAAIYSPYPGSELYEEAIKHGWTPPQHLEDWDKTREELQYPYVKNIWYLRSIIYACYFYYAMNSPSRDLRIDNRFYNIIGFFLKKLSGFRWRHRFFEFPVEYMIVNNGVRFLRDFWRLRKILFP